MGHRGAYSGGVRARPRSVPTCACQLGCLHEENERVMALQVIDAVQLLLLLLFVSSSVAVGPALAVQSTVYTHGEDGFPCIRIPSTLALPFDVMLSFAAARSWSGDVCYTQPSPRLHVGCGPVVVVLTPQIMVARRAASRAPGLQVTRSATLRMSSSVRPTAVHPVRAHLNLHVGCVG